MRTGGGRGGEGGGGWSTGTALALALAGLAAVNLVRSAWVPGDRHLIVNGATAVGAVGVARAAGLTEQDLGLARDRWRAGLRYGGAAFLAVTAVVAIGGLAGLVADDRVDVDRGSMLLRVLVLIPVGTVLVEEVVFRGALHGLLVEQTGSVRRARWWGALAFGLWHVYPAWRGGGVETDVVAVGSAGLVAVTFAATSVAGWALVWLRTRSGSLLAPALAHLATNSVTFYVAWLAG